MSTLNPYFYAYNPELLAFENAWVKFLKNGEINPKVIRKEIYDSWRRCVKMALDPLDKTPPPLLNEEELKARVSSQKELLKVVTPFMDTLYETFKNSGFRVDFIDADGYILKSVGDEETLEICQKTRSFPGANRLEEVAGTNAVNLAMRLKLPIQVAGAEHFMQMFQRWSCSSAPIIAKDQQVLGVLNIAGRYELVHLHTLGMVSAAAKAIENEIYIQKINAQLIEGNNQLRATLEMVTDGVVYTERGKIVQVNREMCTFLGKTEEEIIGRDVCQEVITSPNLKDMLMQRTNSYREGEIILRGLKRSYKCLFDFKTVSGQNQEQIGTVMIFTRVDEIQMLARKIKYTAKYTFDDIVGHSLEIQNAIEMAKRAAKYDSRVIIEGESGTGKEMFAQAIHNYSARKYGPFVALDCGALSKELLESELFGYESGAFTGAKKEGKVGLFELANKGTIFLDEIGNMPTEMQTKLLRVLQEGTFSKVGGTAQLPTDVRIIAATNANLALEVQKGTFRQDLYYRLNVFYLKTPPLRERKEDIPLLAEHFMNISQLKKRKIKIDKKAMKVLQNYDWPGNIRQLNNTIERALIMCNGEMIQAEDLSLETHMAETAAADFYQKNGECTLNEMMQQYIRYIVDQNNRNISKAARVLGVTRATVYKALGKGVETDGNE